MAKPIDHDSVSGAATVAKNAAGGAVLGAFTPLLALGAAAAALVGVIALAVNFPLVMIPALVIGIPAAIATAPIWGTAAGIGAILGAGKGVHQVRSEQRAFDERTQGLQPAPSPEMQQEIFQAGVQAGANQVLDRLQEVQSQLIAQEHAQVQPAQETKLAVSAPPAPPAAEPQQVHHHHFVHAPEVNVEAVHATEENGEHKRSFTSLVGGSRNSDMTHEEKLLAQRQAANDTSLAQPQRA